MIKRYAKRDIETLGQRYMDHLKAMTLEGLESKSDIAAELAYRDVEIDRLQDMLDQYYAYVVIGY